MEQRKSFLLRLSPALWVELEAWAQNELRSVNAQIEYLLREAVIQHRRSRRWETASGDPDPRESTSATDASLG